MSKLDDVQQAQIAKMMGVTPEEVTPEKIAQWRGRRHPGMITVIDGRPGRTHLELLSDEQAQDAIRETEELASLADGDPS